MEQRPKLRRLTLSRPQLGVRNDKQKVSLNLTKSSGDDDDDECNFEVFKALCSSGSASQMTGSPRDADGIASSIRSNKWLRRNNSSICFNTISYISRKTWEWVFHSLNQFIIQFYLFRRRSQQLIFPSITDCTGCTGWEVNFNDLKKEGGGRSRETNIVLLQWDDIAHHDDGDGGGHGHRHYRWLRGQT